MSLHQQCHSGSVWRVTWAHPEFGQVLATCSFDRTVAVWEEQGCHRSQQYSCVAYMYIFTVGDQKRSSQATTETHWVGIAASQV